MKLVRDLVPLKCCIQYLVRLRQGKSDDSNLGFSTHVNILLPPLYTGIQLIDTDWRTIQIYFESIVILLGLHLVYNYYSISSNACDRSPSIVGPHTFLNLGMLLSYTTHHVGPSLIVILRYTIIGRSPPNLFIPAEHLS